MSVSLQLALDMVDVDAAFRVAVEAGPAVDILEAGTPLIKQHGLRVVRELRAAFPDKLIFADMKTADVGALEVRMAAESGADFVSVLAVAPEETMVSAIAEARRLGGLGIAADLLGVKDVVAVGRRLASLAVDLALVHTGIDEQRAGRAPLAAARQVATIPGLALAVAGGIDLAILPEILDLPNVSVVVVGGAITREPQPGRAARRLRDLILGRH